MVRKRLLATAQLFSSEAPFSESHAQEVSVAQAGARTAHRSKSMRVHAAGGTGPDKRDWERATPCGIHAPSSKEHGATSNGSIKLHVVIELHARLVVDARPLYAGALGDSPGRLRGAICGPVSPECVLHWLQARLCWRVPSLRQSLIFTSSLTMAQLIDSATIASTGRDPSEARSVSGSSRPNDRHRKPKIDGSRIPVEIHILSDILTPVADNQTRPCAKARQDARRHCAAGV